MTEVLQRNIEPGFFLPELKQLPEVRAKNINPFVQLFTIDGGVQPVFSMSLDFPFGQIKHSNPVMHSMMLKMLKMGTQRLNSQELNEQIDFYGSFIEFNSGKEKSSLHLHSIHTYAAESIELLKEMLYDSQFPEKELKQKVNSAKQNFKISLEKVAEMANRAFYAELFKNSRLGEVVEEHHFDEINRSQLLEYYHETLHKAQFRIYAAGQVNTVLPHIEKAFDVSSLKNIENESDNLNANPRGFFSQYLPKQDALQSAIRIGRVLFNRSHPDYQKMQVVNTILGGYFGSRLMSNIREDKGFTYGIGSRVQSFKNTGIFYIATEVGKDHRTAAINEIYFEIEKLQTEFVNDQELEIVKNYMLGSILKTFDGPFEQIQAFSSLANDGYDLTYFQKLSQAIISITPEEIKHLAGKYLNKSDLIEISAG